VLFFYKLLTVCAFVCVKNLQNILYYRSKVENIFPCKKCFMFYIDACHVKQHSYEPITFGVYHGYIKTNIMNIDLNMKGGAAYASS